MSKYFSKTIICLIFITFCIFSLKIGVKDFSLIGLIKGDDKDIYITVISRLPRLISIIISGIALSISGLIMQTLTNNKFVSPTTAGTMEWCKLGIVLSIIMLNNKSSIEKITFAFIISLLGNLIFMFIVNKLKFKSSFILPLVGIMLGNIISSITTFIAYNLDIIQNISSWLQGNFSLIIKGNFEILYIGLPCVILAYIYANKFTIAGLGESFSISLGLNYKNVVILGLVIVSFLTSLIVVTVGSIPFVGLIIPNIITLYKGDNLRNTLFDTALLGATFVLFCDILGRIIIFPYEINVSTIVSVLGSFIFLFILFKKHK